MTDFSNTNISGAIINKEKSIMKTGKISIQTVESGQQSLDPSRSFKKDMIYNEDGSTMETKDISIKRTVLPVTTATLVPSAVADEIVFQVGEKVFPASRAILT